MRHNEAQIQLAVAMFKKACDNAQRTVVPGKPPVWSGSTCEGGGWTCKHKMNEDAMTPQRVAIECGLKNMLAAAQACYDAKMEQLALKYIGKS